MTDLPTTPVIDADRVVDRDSYVRPTPLLVFDCPHCWTYGGSQDAAP